MAVKNILRQLASNPTMADPGASGTLTVTQSPVTCLLASAGAETRTLARPTKAGVIVTLLMQTDGGDITLTVTGNYNENGDSTFTFSDPGQFVQFISGYESSGGTYYWRMLSSHLVAQLLTSGGAAFLGRVTTTDGVSSGTARVVGGLAYSSTAASTAVTGSTTAEQLFDANYTIPANTLKAGTTVKIRAQGIATGTQANDTVAYKLYIGGSGGTALVSAAATDAANNDTFQMESLVVCRTAGATGTFVGTGTYKVSSAEGTMTVKDDIVASTTINTTANQAVVVTATWSAANATNTCRLDILTVEIH